MEDIRNTLTPGVLFANKYRIERVLGEGGMGVVLAAEHVYTRDRVALKFLLPAAMQSAEVTTRFLNEARAAVQIKSEHVGRVMDVDVLPSGIPYMVMEYLDGRDLGVVIAEMGALPIGTAVDYLLQACEALAEAHALGIVHRDLKPSNIFLTRRRDGTALVKVLDFGISKAGGTQNTMQMTKTSSILGSPLYMSPEQMTNPKAVDARSDVWSMGVVLHELLTVTWPFLSETVQGLAVEIVTQPPRPIRAVRPELPAELERLILRCLEKRPEARYASIGELAKALAPFASGGQSALSVERISRVLLGPSQTLDPLPTTRPVPQATTAQSWSSTASGAVPQTMTGAETDRGGTARPSRWPLVGAVSLVAAATVAVAAWSLSRGDAATSSARLIGTTASATSERPAPASDALLAIEQAAPAVSSAPATDGQSAAPSTSAQNAPAHAAPVGSMAKQNQTRKAAPMEAGETPAPQPSHPSAPKGGQDFGGR